MIEFNKIGEDLFNKIRGRFPEVTIGDEVGTVTNEPELARFFDFNYNGLGKVSISIDEDEGLTVIYSKDFMEDQDEMTKGDWYDFLKELRIFGKKRMLDYSVRDITKSNLEKRDYKFLAKTPEDENMNESKLYGTSKISYQNVGEARIMIKHTESVNQESTSGRTRNIGKIYIESADGERFMYPFKHLSGARAMAMHVSEGGKPHDDFGTHVVGLSEEMAKLRKFKNYMGRSAVMAESLAGYNDIVNDRIKNVKKTIENIQKESHYKKIAEEFVKPVLEDVPSDVAENWIDQLTIKQFNEELKDVFPYIYKLVGEATKAKELDAANLLDEGAETMVCKDCGDEMHKPTTDCEHDCDDENGSHWKAESESGDDLPDGHAEPNEQKTPLGEFILSYFDKESGQFPKGETAVLTMIEKDYGEQFIEPAKAFIESVTAKFEEFQMRTQPQQMEPGSDESNTEALKMNKYGDMEGMPEPDESMADLSRSMMQPKLADALAKAADVNRKDVYFDDADLVWGSKTVVQSCLADKECTFQHAVDELKKFANSNPKAETQNMDRMRELAGLR